MNIGIDIDETIAKTWETLMPICAEMYNINIDELKTLPPYYGALKKFISFEEYLKMMRKCEWFLQEVPLQENVKEVLTKLKEEGNKIIFITARGNAYSDPYGMTKKYLDNLSIPYDKIIVNALEKGIVCKEEKIDLFIDDSIKNCKDVSQNGIEVLLIETYLNENEKEFIHMKDWNQIYEYIKNR